ncbi:aminoglycoside phosphotransferase family protein [Thermaerobacillus caldiproteolyticus]|nr:aminoglycoside phosphotransferase family protein [Anoxybacillus caldiproteolyticus]
MFCGFSCRKRVKGFSAPLGYPSWYSIKKKKSDKYLKELKKINLDENIKETLETYIKKNETLMKGRPSKFQHDDFHPSNILINNKSFSGIIDFQRMDWGDPIHDLHKLGFFSKQVSIEFTKGIIDGYHENQVLNESFWELYALYSAMHIVSALVWGMGRSREQYEVLLKYSLDVIKDHDNFNCVIPKWYANDYHS